MPDASRDSSRPHRKSKRRYYRPSHRKQQHAEAHREPLDAPPLLDHPLVPPGEPEVIDTPAALAAALDDLRAAGTFAFDTEFIGELHFYPRTCVIQAATTSRVYLIDALAPELDLHPVWALVSDASVQKLVHAGKQDFEPVARLLNEPPRNVFDTQIAAGFAGLEYPMSLTRLIAALAEVEVSPGAKFTQWDRRPLTEVQRRYAANDVRYLPLLKDRLDARLAELGNADWCARELASLEDVELYRYDPLARKLKAKGVGSLGRRKTAVLNAVRRWRATTAEAEDVPPRLLVGDEVLMALAVQQPRDRQALQAVKGLPRPVKEDFGKQLLAAIKDGVEGPPAPKKQQLPRLTGAQERRVDALWQTIHERCAQRGLAPGVVLAKRDVVAFVRDTTDTTEEPAHSPLTRGWRGELLGDLLSRGDS